MPSGEDYLFIMDINHLAIPHLGFRNDKDGLVQLGLMWRRVELGFGIDTDRHINP